MNIFVKKQTYIQLEALAKERNTSMSSIVDDALYAYIDALERKNASDKDNAF